MAIFMFRVEELKKKQIKVGSKLLFFCILLGLFFDLEAKFSFKIVAGFRRMKGHLIPEREIS
jgi:hypothetical protein